VQLAAVGPHRPLAEQGLVGSSVGSFFVSCTTALACIVVG
jgi:hypothetical protein